MFSYKVLVRDCCILFMLFISYVYSEINETRNVDDGPKGNCTCGGFASEKIAPDSVPILSQCPGLVVKCDEGGKNTCKTLCLALSTAVKAKGPEVLCTRLITANELKAIHQGSYIASIKDQLERSINKNCCENGGSWLIQNWLSGFYKVCDMPFEYTGLTSDVPLCCENSKPKICPSVITSNSTMQEDKKPAK